MSDQVFWFISRSAGLTSWMAACLAILVGTMTPSRLLGRRLTIPWLVDFHRMLAALASVFLVVHMAALWFDHFVQFRWADLLIPWAAEVPGLSRTSLALGVIAAWLLAAVQITSLVQRRLPHQFWYTIHLSSYLTVVLGTIHAIMAGSDVTNPILAALGVSTLTAVILATVVRLMRAGNDDGRSPSKPDPQPQRQPERQQPEPEVWTITPQHQAPQAGGWPPTPQHQQPVPTSYQPPGYQPPGSQPPGSRQPEPEVWPPPPEWPRR